MQKKEASVKGYLTNNRLISVFAFVAGFVDVSGYALLNGLYTASTTSNIVVAGVSVNIKPRKSLVRLAVVCAFGLGVFLNASLHVKLRFATIINRSTILSQAIAAEVVVLIAATVVCLVLHTFGDSTNSWFRLLAGAMLSFTMGIHNATLCAFVPETCVTSALTFNFMTIVVDSTEALCFYLASKSYFNLAGSGADQAPDYSTAVYIRYEEGLLRCRPQCCAVISFVVGALVGGSLAKTIHYWCFLMPIMVLTMLAVSTAISGQIERRKSDVIDPQVLQEVHIFCLTTEYSNPNSARQKTEYKVLDDSGKINNMHILDEEQLGSRTYSSSSSV